MDESFQTLLEVVDPLHRVQVHERRVLPRVLDVRKRIKGEELRGPGKFRASRVQVLLEVGLLFHHF